MIIHCEAVLDILGHDHDPAVQLISDGERIGVIGEQTDELCEAVQKTQAELLHHFAALSKAQEKYTTKIHRVHHLQEILESVHHTDWKQKPEYEEWKGLTLELSKLIHRLETLLGREMTSQEFREGFDG